MEYNTFCNGLVAVLSPVVCWCNMTTAVDYNVADLPITEGMQIGGMSLI